MASAYDPGYEEGKGIGGKRIHIGNAHNRVKGSNKI